MKKKSLNIGIFTDTYYPQINGVVTSILMLKKELTKLGHRVFIFTTTDPNIKKAEKAADVFRIPSVKLSFLPTHRMAVIYPPKLIVKMKSFKLDIIHTHTEFPLGFLGKLVSEIYNIPMVHTYHTMYEDYTHYILNGHLLTPKFAKNFSRFFCNRAKVVIAPVDKAHNYLKSVGVTREIRTIPTGLDFAPFNSDNFSDEDLTREKLELGICEEDSVIVAVGRVAKEKSLDVLINMMPPLLQKLPTVKLLIIGDGPLREELQQLTITLNVQNNVIFAGAKPWNIIGKYYSMGDIFATASTSETQGLTYIEAMAAKVPVVVKRDPSFAELVRHGETGFLFDNDEDAANIMYYALTNQATAVKVATKAFESIQPLSAKQYALDVSAVYESLVTVDKKNRLFSKMPKLPNIPKMPKISRKK
ncbi:MAG: glycosyltransferase family 4 protein [Firmicutes bacterium]|nr:glycosyltransferase family 4 protein [Bacillota bacterium]